MDEQSEDPLYSVGAYGGFSFVSFSWISRIIKWDNKKGQSFLCFHPIT